MQKLVNEVPVPLLLCPPQIPHGLTWGISRWLTDWALYSIKQFSARDWFRPNVFYNSYPETVLSLRASEEKSRIPKQVE